MGQHSDQNGAERRNYSNLPLDQSVDCIQSIHNAFDLKYVRKQWKIVHDYFLGPNVTPNQRQASFISTFM